MPITTEDKILDTAKQQSLTEIRENLETVFSNQEGDPEVIVSDTIQDITPEEVDEYLRKIVQEQDLPMKSMRLSREIVKDQNLYNALCDYVQVYPIPQADILFLHFLESSNFAVTIISLGLGNGTTRVRMEPMELSPEMIKKQWKKIIGAKTEKIDPSKIPGIKKASQIPQSNLSFEKTHKKR